MSQCFRSVSRAFVAQYTPPPPPHAPARSLIRRRRSLPRPRPPARPIGFLYQNRHERLTQTKGRAGGRGGGLAVGGDGTDNNNWAAVAQVERGLHSEISHLITCSHKIVVGTNICRVKGASACRAEAQTAQCDAFLLLLWTVHRDNDGDRGRRELGPPPWHWPFLPPSVPLHERLVAPVVAPPTFNGDGSLARSIRTFGGEGGKVCPLLISLPAARVPSHPNSKVPTYPSRLVPWLKYPEDMTCPECVSIVSLVKYTSLDGDGRTRTDRVD